MPNPFAILVLAALLMVTCGVEAATPPAGSGAVLAVAPHDLCGPAIARAEAAQGIPRGLLGAVALAESGRWDAERERLASWPWTVNNGGDGRYFGSRGEAVAWVGELQGRGRSNIDVGCMQINLKYHPDAFASLTEAFEPRANAAYAARFLAGLRRETGSWPRAVERYHTADAERGRAYRERVYARLDSVDDTLVRGTGNEVAAAGEARPAPPRGSLSSLWTVNRSLLAARGVALPPAGMRPAGRRPVVLGPRTGDGEPQAEQPRRFFAIRRAVQPTAGTASLRLADRPRGGGASARTAAAPPSAAIPVASWASIPSGRGRIGLSSHGPFGAIGMPRDLDGDRAVGAAARRTPPLVLSSKARR